jgi:DNA repair protein RadC
VSWWPFKGREMVGGVAAAGRRPDIPTGFSEAPNVSEFSAANPTALATITAAMTATDPRVVSDPQFSSLGPHGHRARMREKLLGRGPNALADYELLEMLLFYAMPKGDTKPLAKALINHFGSFPAVLTAQRKELLAFSGLKEHGIAALKLVHASALRLVKADLMESPILNNWERLADYLHAVLGRERTEQFRVLFMDSKNRLIRDELLGRGTVNHTPVYPREVLKRALELQAMAIILVHNHPSGDPSPSEEDIVMTQEIKAATAILQITLHDHVIVGNGRLFSLLKHGLL